MARPSKLNPAVEKAICDALRSGNTRKAAAAYAGIDPDTLRNWELNNSVFSDAIKKASADHEVYCVAIIKKAMPTHWQAGAWWLERSRPDDYGSNLTLRADRAAEKLLAAIIANVEGTGDGDDGATDIESESEQSDRKRIKR